MSSPVPCHRKKLKRKRLKCCEENSTIKRKRRKLEINILAPQGLSGPAGAAGSSGIPGLQGVTGAPGAGLLHFYQFFEIPDPMVPGGPAITTVTLPAAPAATGPELQVSDQFISLRGINHNSRIALTATIVWSFTFVTETAPELTVASQIMQFSIFRDTPLVGKRVCTVIDSGRVAQINLDGMAVTVVSGTYTTTFECTDTGVIGPTANYYLTAAAGNASGFGVPDDAFPVPITNFTNPTINEIHFSGRVILPG